MSVISVVGISSPYHWVNEERPPWSSDYMVTWGEQQQLPRIVPSPSTHSPHNLGVLSVHKICGTKESTVTLFVKNDWNVGEPSPICGLLTNREAPINRFIWIDLMGVWFSVTESA